ncbi:ankyrin-3-like [Haliotis asinina]|uniref:ankyrin-3-like n=1 Tax=Haliotis asinina TaxID=109174 RepID=UPI0035321629
MVAAVAGHRELLELLVEKGANLSLLDDQDNNILHLVCMEGNLEIVKYIYSRKIIDIDSRGGNGTTPLMSAALFGKMDVYCFLMKIGADMSQENDDGENILHMACQGGNVKIVKYILTQNIVDINGNDDNKMTPFLLAAYHGNSDVLELLVQKGANTLAVNRKRRNSLHLSCTGGHVDAAKYVLNQTSVDINSKDCEEMTPVMLAASHGKSEVFDILMKKGADLSVTDENGDNILHCSCRGGNVEIVNYILKRNTLDVNSKGHEEKTPVMLAASHGKSEVFDILMKKGADLSVTDENGDNILHCACGGGNVEIVNYILKRNTLDVNSKGHEEKTPVMLAASHGKSEVFDILMKKGADLSVTDENDDNILHSACRGGNVKIVNYILKRNTLDVNSKGYEEKTPVMLAASQGKSEVFNILTKTGADLSVIDENGHNILHSACRGGNVNIVSYILIQSSLDINSKCHDGLTPVMHSASQGKNEVFDILVKNGANLSDTDVDGSNILHWACRGGNAKIVNYILFQNIADINSKNGDGETPVLLAAWHGRREVFDVLVVNGANLSVVDKNGDNILYFACSGKDEQIVQHVLELHIVDINCRTTTGMTPLMIAAEHNAHDVFKLLLDSGGDPSVVNSDGNNALYFACSTADGEIVKNLLKLDLVDINCRGSDGMTPLLLAARYNTHDVFELLLENGADPSLVNGDGNNVLHFACMADDEEIVKHILEPHLVDINSRGFNKMTPLLLSAEHSACDVFEMLLDNGADPSVVDSDGNNVLHLACAKRDKDFVRYVLSRNIVDVTSRNKLGMNATEIASLHGNLPITKLLLQASQSERE